MLAWAYILSARWAEIIPGASLIYTASKADGYLPDQSPPVNQPSLTVDITDVDADQARFWAAVLAPDQGWHATVSLGDDGTWVSPWSVLLKPGFDFFVQAKLDIRPHGSETVAPSFSRALRFIDNFCHRRNITDQSHAALAAVLIFRSSAGNQGLQLPAFTTTRLDIPAQVAPSDPQPQSLHLQHETIDRLITLGCYEIGVLPMLLSSFYSPEILCNAVSPWLQGALAAIDEISDPLILARVLMDREPKAAALWVGIAVLGLQKGYLKNVGYGMIPANLHSAVWSGTTQSFIQLPVSSPAVKAGKVSREDQCKLLFLARSGSHDRAPVGQWTPFGATPLEDTDIEVRLHAVHCGGHGLQYQGILWDCIDGKTNHQLPRGDGICERPSPPLPEDTSKPDRVPINYQRLNYDKDFISKGTTSIIFRWLRSDGCAVDEKYIWEDDWLDLSIMDSDEEIEDQDKDSCGSGKSFSLVKDWLLELSEQP
ncbi:hypothetical protein QBC44DRAFT_391556 [Cladorrhinum sp. PSN332]|nr:hypothetical protein QBC44DRAFT_391556 [Cladorrhinum sp. PSN332]